MKKSHYSVIIVGGGQAGLAISYLLKQESIDHVIFEKNQIGHAWRNQRWDSFCLVTPNWQCRLPGFPYAGGDDQGFMLKDEIVQYLEDYAASFQAPILEGVEVSKLSQRTDAFEVITSQGIYTLIKWWLLLGATIRQKLRRSPKNYLPILSSYIRWTTKIRKPYQIEFY